MKSSSSSDLLKFMLIPTKFRLSLNISSRRYHVACVIVLRCVGQYVVGGGVMRCDAGDNTSWEAASCIVLWGRG